LFVFVGGDGGTNGRPGRMKVEQQKICCLEIAGLAAKTLESFSSALHLPDIDVDGKRRIVLRAQEVRTRFKTARHAGFLEAAFENFPGSEPRCLLFDRGLVVRVDVGVDCPHELAVDVLLVVRNSGSVIGDVRGTTATKEHGHGFAP